MVFLIDFPCYYFRFSMAHSLCEMARPASFFLAPKDVLCSLLR